MMIAFRFALYYTYSEVRKNLKRIESRRISIQ